MNIFPSVLFTLAAIAAVSTIWKSIAAALPVVRTLRTQLARASQERVIHVTRLDTRPAIADEPRARPRRHHPQPKPVTHRLHHFAHRAHAA